MVYIFGPITDKILSTLFEGWTHVVLDAVFLTFAWILCGLQVPFPLARALYIWGGALHLFTSVFGAVTTAILQRSQGVPAGLSSAFLHFITAVIFFNAAIRSRSSDGSTQDAELLGVRHSLDELRKELRRGGCTPAVVETQQK